MRTLEEREEINQKWDDVREVIGGRACDTYYDNMIAADVFFLEPEEGGRGYWEDLRPGRTCTFLYYKEEGDYFFIHTFKVDDNGWPFPGKITLVSRSKASDLYDVMEPYNYFPEGGEGADLKLVKG